MERRLDTRRIAAIQAGLPQRSLSSFVRLRSHRSIQPLCFTDASSPYAKKLS
jgi:hypothetical protein